jgi:predicted metalloprotease with PDZ domain
MLTPVLSLLLAASPAAAPAPIRLAVDAREVTRKLVHAHLTLPAAPGPLSLVYPKWIPGEHGPTGPLVNLMGLVVHASGQAVPWKRDPVEMYAIEASLPAGATSVDVDLDFMVPTGGDFTAGRSASDQLAVLSWNTVLLYPRGVMSDAVTVQASLRVPAGWSHATALPEAGGSGEELSFAPVTLTRLIDSPVLMGAHLHPVRLGTGEPLHEIEVAADSAADLELKPEWKASFDRLPEQAFALFGARHYGSYRWLLSLSDHVEHFGLEHHESSDDRMAERSFADDRGRRGLASLLSHEYVHSWNGKFRRPAGIATGDYIKPMQTSLLWVYEGLTQYLGVLLPARSGLWTPEEYRENLAAVVADLDEHPGRQWRPLEDTATAAQLLYGSPEQGRSWRRSTDFYDESILVWLEADVIIRNASQGQRTLDDFCHRFHGGPDGPYIVKPYSLDQVVLDLNAVAPHDWRGFFADRIERVSTHAPRGGLEGSGWKLVFTDQPNVFRKDHEERDKDVDEASSIGIRIAEDGDVKDVVHGMTAAKAGIAAGMKVIAVNGRRFSKEALRDALRATRSGTRVELLVEDDDFFHTHPLDYDGGLRYPHLVREESKPDLLSQILTPRK